MSEYYKASKGRWNSSQRAIVYIIITMHARIVPHLFAKYARCITHVQTYTHTYIRKHVLYVHRHIVCVFVYLCICVHAYLVLAKRAGWAHGGPSLFKICKEGIACRFQGHVCLCVCVCVCLRYNAAQQCEVSCSKTMRPTLRGFVLVFAHVYMHACFVTLWVYLWEYLTTTLCTWLHSIASWSREGHHCCMFTPRT